MYRVIESTIHISSVLSAGKRLVLEPFLRGSAVHRRQIIMHELRRSTSFVLEKYQEIIFLFFCLDIPYVVV